MYYIVLYCCIDVAVILQCRSLVLSWMKDWRQCVTETWGLTSTAGRLLSLRWTMRLLRVLHLIQLLRCLPSTILLPVVKGLQRLSRLSSPVGPHGGRLGSSSRQHWWGWRNLGSRISDNPFFKPAIRVVKCQFENTSKCHCCGWFRWRSVAAVGSRHK